MCEAREKGSWSKFCRRNDIGFETETKEADYQVECGKGDKSASERRNSPCRQKALLNSTSQHSVAERPLRQTDPRLNACSTL